MNKQNEIQKLPLWKNALEELLSSGVHYGEVISAEWFEERLKVGRNEMRFGLDISKIRRALENCGYYLSGRGQKGAQFVILEPSANASVMKSYSRLASDALKRGVILGTNTRLDTLSDADRRRHEATLERMAIKVALLAKSQSVARVVTENNPQLLR